MGFFLWGCLLGLEVGGVSAARLGSRAAASERGVVKRMSTWGQPVCMRCGIAVATC